MNNVIKLLKGIKLDKKTVFLIIGGITAAILLLLGELTASKEETSVSADNTAAYSHQYIKNAQNNLEKTLSEINGAGKVTVLITLESCYENVYAKSYEQEKDVKENGEQGSYKEEYAIVKKGSQNEECLIIKVYEPQIKGVAVVCEGGDKTAVQKAITETVCALYDISTNKVSVTKMN